jgi:hypothetical protein
MTDTRLLKNVDLKHKYFDHMLSSVGKTELLIDNMYLLDTSNLINVRSAPNLLSVDDIRVNNSAFSIICSKIGDIRCL